MVRNYFSFSLSVNMVTVQQFGRTVLSAVGSLEAGNMIKVQSGIEKQEK